MKTKHKNRLQLNGTKGCICKPRGEPTLVGGGIQATYDINPNCPEHGRVGMGVTMPPTPLLKLDFGCGPNPRDGFEGVDQYSFDGKVKHVMQIVEPIHEPIPAGFEWMADVFERKVIGYKPWPWGDCSVSEAHASHFVEHLTAVERIHFVNELHRVLVPGGKCTLIVPHWGSCRAYGDPTHQWPPFSEFAFYYLKREWRMANAPHTDASNWPLGFTADLDAVWGYGIHPHWQLRNQEAQQFATSWYKEAISDIHCTLSKPTV